MLRLLLTSLVLIFASMIFAQSGDAYAERAKGLANSRDRMKVYYKAAEVSLATEPAKSSQWANIAYSLALDNDDNSFAARAAYKNGEGFEARNQLEDALVRFNRGKENAIQAKDYDYAAKCLNKMSAISQQLGRTKKAKEFKQEADDWKNNSTEIAESPNTTAKSPSAIKSTPNNLAEMNAMRDQFKKQTELLERDRTNLFNEVSLLREEKSSLSQLMTELRNREQSLSVQTKDALQKLDFQSLQLRGLNIQKDELDRLAHRKQELLEAVTNGAKLDSLVFAQEREEQGIKLDKVKTTQKFLYALLILGAIIILLVLKRYSDNLKQKKTLIDKNKTIEHERQRSEELLLNILPHAISSELKTEGFAKARRYEFATVMFIDFKSFTKISEQLSPEDLVKQLDMYFRAFDFIIAQYKLEKIKTIGDAYMVASGLSDRLSSPTNMVKAALEIQEYLSDTALDKKELGEPHFEARIGIHTGPVVAGVVGVKKFAYDIWGDTVNVAARLQETCETGSINISEATFNEIKYFFPCTYRGRLNAKNKGVIDMYYVNNKNALAKAVSLHNNVLTK